MEKSFNRAPLVLVVAVTVAVSAVAAKARANATDDSRRVASRRERASAAAQRRSDKLPLLDAAPRRPRVAKPLRKNF